MHRVYEQVHQNPHITHPFLFIHTQADTELQRMHRVNEHKALDIKALKSALKHRDEQV